MAVAGALKRLCRNGWLAERLDMVLGSSVSRYVGEMLSGGRNAMTLYEELIEKIED